MNVSLVKTRGTSGPAGCNTRWGLSKKGGAGFTTSAALTRIGLAIPGTNGADSKRIQALRPRPVSGSVQGFGAARLMALSIPSLARDPAMTLAGSGETLTIVMVSPLFLFRPAFTCYFTVMTCPKVGLPEVTSRARITETKRSVAIRFSTKPPSGRSSNSSRHCLSL